MTSKEYAEVHGVLRPKVSRFAFYIDDGGSATENLVGHTMILLDEYSIRQLEADIRGTLERYNLTELHARMLNAGNLAGHNKAYDELFTNFANCFGKANLKYCSSRLGPNIEQNRNYQALKALLVSFFKKI